MPTRYSNNKGFILIIYGLLTGWAQANALESRYVSFSESSLRRCTIAQIKKPNINICLSGQATGPDLERAKTWAARASLTWLRVMKVLDEQVTRQIVFTCANPNLTIYLRPGGGTSHATPSNSTIYLTRPYGTWTHELGHALAGLGDTYQGSAGKCGNQPQSLMCWGAYGPRANPEEWSTLWPDDINGIKANYKKIFPGNSVPPVWANNINLEKPLNLDDPWPESGFAAPAFEDHRVVVLKGPASEIDYDENTESIDL
jgi:hypothetical protein